MLEGLAPERAGARIPSHACSMGDVIADPPTRRRAESAVFVVLDRPGALWLGSAEQQHARRSQIAGHTQGEQSRAHAHVLLRSLALPRVHRSPTEAAQSRSERASVKVDLPRTARLAWARRAGARLAVGVSFVRPQIERPGRLDGPGWLLGQAAQTRLRGVPPRGERAPVRRSIDR
jgi:hypothetical protein